MNPALLRRAQLLPGESLVSLLERLTQINYYPSVHTLQQICRSRLEAPASQDGLRLPQWVETFLQLADLTHISPEELYAASGHRFAPFLTLPQQPPVEIPWIGSRSKTILTPNLARRRLRSPLAAQYCPRCLKSAAYHRLRWIPISSTICLEHDCLLTSRCPQCHRSISIQEIVRQRCRSCLADLTSANPLYVEGDELGIRSQRSIQSWLMDGNVTKSLDPPSQHPAVLYDFLEYLARRLLNRKKDWPSLSAPLDGLSTLMIPSSYWSQALTPDGLFRLLRAAFTGVTNWPNGLFRFLDAYCGVTPLNDVQRLRSFQRDWFQPPWKIPSLEFLQQGYLGYLLARNLPLPFSLVKRYQHVAWFSEQTGLWSEERTAQTLGVSLERLHFATPCGPMVACRWPGSRTTLPLFQRDKVLALNRKWRRGWSVYEASSWLGLEKKDVIELVKRGELILLENRNEDENHWVITRNSADAYFEKVVARLELYQGNRRDLACLFEAAHESSNLGIDAVTLLQGVVDGFLPAYKRDPEVPSLGHTCFLKDMTYYLPDLCYARYGWVSGYVFARERGFFHRTVMDWVGAGLIKPQKAFGHHMYFVRQDLEELWAKSVSD